MWKVPLPTVLLAAFVAGIAGFLIRGTHRKSAALGSSDADSNGRPAPSVVEPSKPAATALAELERVAGEIASAEGRGNFVRHYAQLYETVARLTAAELEGALGAASHAEPMRRVWMIDALLTRWAELDPKAATEYAVNAGHYSMVERGSNPLHIWALQDFDAARAWLLSLPDEAKRQSAMPTLALALAKRDPRAAIELLDANVKAHPGEAMLTYSTVLEHWIAKDPNAATQYVLALKDWQKRQHLLGSLARAGNRAPEEMIALADQIAEPDAHMHFVRELTTRWAHTAPGEAIKYLGTKPPPREEYELALVTSIAAERDLEETRRAVEELPEGEARAEAMGALIAHWANEDLRAAAAYAKKLPVGRTRNQALSELTRHLAKDGPHAALELAETMPAGRERAEAFSQIASEWAENDPRAAAEYFADRKGEHIPSNPLSTVMDSWIRRAPKEVLEWSHNLPEGIPNWQTLGQAISAIAETNRELAIAELNRLTGEGQAWAAGALVGSWVSEDASAAATWAASLPEGDTRSHAFSALIGSWADLDARAATAWVEKLPAGKSRDSAVGALGASLIYDNPTAALTWAGRITDKKERASTVEELATTWLFTETAAATAWVRTTPLLDKKTRDRLLQLARSPSAGSQ